MRLKILLTLIGLNLFSSGCAAKIPDKTLCDLQTEDFVLHANGALSLEDLKAIINNSRPISCFNTKDQKKSKITLKEADKFISVSLPDYQKLDNYVFELERKVLQCK